jgi:hypothetical protein
MIKTIGPGIVLMLILSGCGSDREQEPATCFQNTDVCFRTGNEALQELFDSAEVKVLKNIIQYNDEYKVMVEGRLGLYFQTLQGLYLSEAAFELSFFLGDCRDYFLELVKNGLEKCDVYL